jgi:hypothetical protein
MSQAEEIMRRDGELIDRADEIMRQDERIIASYKTTLERNAETIASYEIVIAGWAEEHAKISKVLDAVIAPREASAPDYLSDEELSRWVDSTNLKIPPGTYLRLVLDELRERRDAEAMFVDVDLQLQKLASRDDDASGTDEERQAVLKRWQIARSALCALARIHRGYLQSLKTSDEGDAS